MSRPNVLVQDAPPRGNNREIIIDMNRDIRMFENINTNTSETGSASSDRLNNMDRFGHIDREAERQVDSQYRSNSPLQEVDRTQRNTSPFRRPIIDYSQEHRIRVVDRRNEGRPLPNIPNIMPDQHRGPVNRLPPDWPQN